MGKARGPGTCTVPGPLSCPQPPPAYHIPSLPEPALDDTPLDLPPEPIGGRYRLQREIGRGGMAIVFLAEDLRYRRRVALKLLRRRLAAFITWDRFRQEIQFAAELSHPHLLPLLDSGEHDGLPYYVIPYQPDGTLRDRLDREGVVPVREALTIARQLASALAVVHARGIIHRDLKPANVLLAGSYPFLADFGIARALSRSTGDAFTETGIVIGTAGYMAPEQARGLADVDARADQYSLAALLHEMLLGTLPYHPVAGAPTDPARRLAEQRPELPATARSAVARALAHDRDQRFPDIHQFGEALAPPPEDAAVTPRKRPLTMLLGAVALAAALLLVPGVPARLGIRDARTSAPDTTRYAVLPFTYDSGIAPLNERAALRDAIGSRWNGVTLVDELAETERIGRQGTAPWTNREALAAARALRAGRFVRGRVSREGDSLRISAGLYDVATSGTQLGFGLGRLPQGAGGGRAEFDRLADVLLLRDALPDDSAVATLGTRSLPAAQAFARGTRAIARWSLAAADSAFEDATGYDPGFSRAHLWLGLSRLWRGLEPSQWRSAAERAAAGRDRLRPVERPRAAALYAAATDPVASCAPWDSVVARAPADFTAWYGAGYCRTQDSVVLPDHRSPTGWRFQSGYHSGLEALVRAFRLEPAVLASYREQSYAALRLLFVTDPHQSRSGRAGGTGFRLAGFPVWQGDSLGFVPESTGVTLPSSGRSPAAIALVADRQRRRLLDAVEAWTAAAPLDPRALEALAVAQDLLGRHDAPATLDRASRLTRDREDRLRVGRSLVWLGLKYALPDDRAALAQLASLTDSLLRAEPPDRYSDPVSLAGLAALAGRPRLAAEYLALPAAMQQWSVPAEVGEVAPRLLLLSAAGASADTLTALARELRRRLERMLDPVLRARATGEWLVRAATLAFPAGTDLDVRSLSGLGDPLLDAQAALAAGDSAMARRLLDRLASMRAGLRPSELTLDGLYPEAALRAALGERRRAAGLLDSVLGAASAMEPDLLADPIRAASLRQAISLRGRLADVAGDSASARRWRGALKALSTSAEP